MTTYRQGVLRTALQPRWLALLALVLVVGVVFGWLGSWQLGIARNQGVAAAISQARTQPVAPIDELLQPQRPFPAAANRRQVSVSGSYDADRTVLVSERLQRGRPGWWVVTALRTDAGAWLPVVRGWVSSPDDERARSSSVPQGPVTVQGALQPDDPPADRSVALPAGQLQQVDAADLVNRWGAPIYNGYLLVSAERGQVTAAQPERVPPLIAAPQGIAWRNAAYAVQWWVFAGFALVLWWKMVRQEQLDRSRERADVDERVAIG